MPTSPRIGLPYPAENSDPWFEAFVGMVEAVDSSLYAGREDRSLLMIGGGTISWSINPLTNVGTLSWSQPIFLTSALTGFLLGIAAGSVTLADGQIFYATLIRAPVENTTITATSGNQLPSSDLTILLGIRKGGNVYFRNGALISDGYSQAVLDSPVFGSTGQIIQRQVPIVLKQKFTDPGAYATYGYIHFDPTKHVITGTTQALSFEVLAYVDSGVTGLVQLYDTTNSAVITTTTVTATVPTRANTSFTLTGAGRIVEVKMCVSSGTGDLNCSWAGIQIDNVFV